MNCTFVGRFYEKDDQSAPLLKGLFDGSQADIVLTMPEDVKVKDLKWISIWCRKFGISFGQFIFPVSDDTTKESVPKAQVIASESGTFTSLLIISKTTEKYL